MLEAIEQRHGSELPEAPVQWLSDNGSAYTAEQTRAFARQIGLLPLTTPVCSPQSNGMAESFVKTMKRDYIRHSPIPIGRRPCATWPSRSSITTRSIRTAH
jgi:putative transposase